MEVRPYNSQSKKLDPKTINVYFIGYCVGSRGSIFYCPLHTTRVIKSYRTIYFEDDTSTSQGLREIVFKEHQVFSHVPIAFALIYSLVVDQHLVATPNNEPIEEVDQEASNEIMEIPLRRSKSFISPQFQMTTLFTCRSMSTM